MLQEKLLIFDVLPTMRNIWFTYVYGTVRTEGNQSKHTTQSTNLYFAHCVFGEIVAFQVLFCSTMDNSVVYYSAVNGIRDENAQVAPAKKKNKEEESKKRLEDLRVKFGHMTLS